MSKVSITQIGFALLCIGSVFMYSTQITDPYIVSKWLYTILFVLIITIYCSIRMLLGKSVKFDTRLAGMSIVIVSSLQAIYGLSQCFNITTFNTFYKIMGSFENPTGFSACLCVSLPFFVVFQLLNENKQIRYLVCFLGIIVVIAIVLSYSSRYYRSQFNVNLLRHNNINLICNNQQKGSNALPISYLGG